MQSQECVTQFISYLKEPKKPLKEEDLAPIMEVYECNLHFVLADIDRHRKQATPVQCFMTLYPWAYDIDMVDMQIVMNNDLTNVICSYFKKDAQTFWLSNFKCQASVMADDFFIAVKEWCELSHITEFWTENAYLFEQVAQQNTAITVRDHADLVSTLIKSISTHISK